MHLYTIATVTVHICTVTVALLFIILLVFSLSFFLYSGCSRSRSHSHLTLTLTAADHQRTPHMHQPRTPHIHQQRKPHQKISSKIKQNKKLVLHRICLVAEKNTEKQEIKKINQTQRKSTLFHHFLTTQTRNKEN